MVRLRIAGAAAGIVLVSALVLQVSSAAFTGSTSSDGSSWAAGTVSLSNDRNGAAMFSSTAMVPGDVVTQCIEVTYTGTADPGAAITLHAANVASVAGGAGGDGLADDLDVTVRIGAAGSDCGDDLSAAPVLYNNGALLAFDGLGSPISTGWTPDAGGGTDLMRPFLFRVELGADTANDAQADSATADFVWSATS